MVEEEKVFNWEIPANEENIDDPLLSCLLMLSKFYQSPCSASTLTSNLPLEDNCLTPALFVRAAKRVGLAAQINKMALKNFSSALLPAVMLLKNGKACILVKVSKTKAQVLYTHTGMGLHTIDFKDLLKQYSGYAIFVRPEYQFSHRSKETFGRTQKNWFWRVLFKAWPIYSEVLVASALISLFALAMPLFVMNIYDRVVPNKAIETMWVLASGVSIVFIFDLILRTLRGYFIDAAGKKVDVELSAVIFEQILGIKMAARPSSVGAFANTVQSFEIFRDFITSTTITVLVDLPFVVIYLLVINFIGGSLVYVPMTMIPIVFIVGFLLQMPLRRMTRESYQHAAEKQAALIESLSGIEAIKSTNAEGIMQQRWEKVTTLSAKLGTKLRFISNSSVNFTLITQQIANVVVVIFGVYKISEGELTMGALIACTILSGRSLAPMSQVAGLFTRYYQSVNALRSLNEVMKMPVDCPEEVNYLHRPNLHGDIVLKGVNYNYEEAQVTALTNININIKSGERIAIIGRLGSGKSTIAKLLMNLYQPNEGSILLDGTDYQQIHPSDIRTQIGYVPQDIVLFYGSVKDNITLGAPHVDDSEVLTAATLAGVDYFVSKHPQGYDRQVGERGANLSRGQRQAIAVARAILLNPNILIFDEPSTSMDDSSEAVLRSNLKQFIDDSKTLILITHKAAMLALVERIIVMDNGRVIADGPKEAVLNALKTGGVKVPRG